MTSTICLWPIFAALSKALLFLQMPVAPEAFSPVNALQQEFISNYFTKGYDKLNVFNDQELRSWASKDADELNRILKKEGFAIQLKPFKDKDSFGVVSILDVLVKWLNKGSKSTIRADGKQYDAVKINAGFDVFSSSNHPYPLLCVSTESGDQVWLTIADEPLAEFALLEKIENIKQDLEWEHYDYAKFPMIDYNRIIDIQWLLKLQIPIPHNYYYIEQALQQTKFKMNEEGAHVKSAVAIGMKVGSAGRPKTPRVLVIDKPFYLWIERSTKNLDLPFPIFAGYFDIDCWKNPGNLDL